MGKHSHFAEVDPEFETVRPFAAEIAEVLSTLPIEQLRTIFDVAPVRPDDLPVDLDIENSKFSARDNVDIPIRIYKSPSVKPNATLFYVMHGGGWTIGGLNTEENMQRYVAGNCRAVVVSVDYRMGPEYRFPYAVNDCFDGLKWCIANADALGIDPERVVVGGSSAGGNLAAVMAIKARDENLPGIVGQVLSIPVTCHPKFFPKDKYEYESWEQNKDSPPLTAELMRWFWNQYLGDTVDPDPHHSPLLAGDLTGLPPTLLLIAGLDPLRDEGLAYADALEAAGVKTTVEIFGGVPHGFGNMIALEKSRKYHSDLIDFVNGLEGPA